MSSAKTLQMIASFMGEPESHLFKTILALEAQQADINRKLSCARRAMKRKASAKKAKKVVG